MCRSMETSFLEFIFEKSLHKEAKNNGTNRIESRSRRARRASTWEGKGYKKG